MAAFLKIGQKPTVAPLKATMRARISGKTLIKKSEINL